MSQIAAHQNLNTIANLLNRMVGIADDKLSQIAAAKNDEAARDALLVAINDLDDAALKLRDLLTRGYSIANND